MRSSLTFRLIALMLMCILPVTAVLFYNLYSLSQAQERRVHDDAYRLGQVAALEMARIVGGLEDTLLAVAAAPVVRRLEPEGCNAYMSRIVVSMPQFAGVAVLDQNGVIRCRQDGVGIGVSLADKEYFRQTMRTGKLVLGKFTRGRVSKELVLPVAVPITGDTGAVTGVVAGSMNLKWLEQRLTERKFSKSGSLTVADRDGTILARYPMPERFVGTKMPDEFRHLINAEAPGTLELKSQDGTNRILAFFPPSDAETGLYVSVGLSIDEEYGTIRRALLRGVLVTLAAVSLAAMLAWFTARRSIRRPVARLVATVDAWKRQEISARTGFSEDDGEFGVVGRAMDEYMNELAEARGRAELLMRELDHRVKNLLATVQVIMRQSLKAANVDPTLLKTITARLGAMSQAHSILMKNGSQSARFAEIVQAAIAPFDAPDFPAFEVSGPDFPVSSSAALAFSMALHELATNAVKYGALSADGGVIIEWDMYDYDGARRLSFTWREKGGPKIELPQRAGFGGLMIKRMLVDQLRGELTASYEPAGLDLRVDIPLSNLLDNGQGNVLDTEAYR